MITETSVAVRYPDSDPMGIVHHAVYPMAAALPEVYARLLAAVEPED